MAVEIAFRGARIIDGSGRPEYRGDVAVRDGRIAEIAAPGRLAGRRVVDADGLVLAPGFVDLHAHSDLALLTDPEHRAKVSQGVTCEVLGQDGLSYAPVDDPTLAQIRRHIAGWNGDPAGLDWSWRSVGEYLDRLDGAAVNACYLVPHGNLRMLAVGWDDRPATAAELDRLRQLLAGALTEGAVGLSAGLTYVPGGYADDHELVELCRVVARHGGFFAPHHRSYGAGAIEAYAEMIEVSRQAGCPLHLTHANLSFPVNAGRAAELIAVVDRALDDGLDLTLDTYPYVSGSTTLAALLPSWASEGGPEQALRRLADPVAFERIRHALEDVGSDGCHGVVVDWSTIEISGVRDPRHREVVGRTIAELAAARSCPAVEAYRELLVADGLGTTILQHVGDEANVRTIMRHRVHTGGSDGLLVGDKPHPRAWGTFTRYLGRYVRELGVLGLVEAVEHLTGRPARRLGLVQRGMVRPGWHADLVLFDPDEVADRATFEQPRLPSAGVHHVLVNGVPVIDGGAHTGHLPGRALRRAGLGVS